MKVLNMEDVFTIQTVSVPLSGMFSTKPLAPSNFKLGSAPTEIVWTKSPTTKVRYKLCSFYWENSFNNLLWLLKRLQNKIQKRWRQIHSWWGLCQVNREWRHGNESSPSGIFPKHQSISNIYTSYCFRACHLMFYTK